MKKKTERRLPSWAVKKSHSCVGTFIGRVPIIGRIWYFNAKIKLKSLSARCLPRKIYLCRFIMEAPQNRPWQTRSRSQPASSRDVSQTGVFRQIFAGHRTRIYWSDRWCWSYGSFEEPVVLWNRVGGRQQRWETKSAEGERGRVGNWVQRGGGASHQLAAAPGHWQPPQLSCGGDFLSRASWGQGKIRF